jgi:hypothetical protein
MINNTETGSAKQAHRDLVSAYGTVEVLLNHSGVNFARPYLDLPIGR